MKGVIWFLLAAFLLLGGDVLPARAWSPPSDPCLQAPVAESGQCVLPVQKLQYAERLLTPVPDIVPALPPRPSAPALRVLPPSPPVLLSCVIWHSHPQSLPRPPNS